jgi:3-phenylpropionate/trans-cinnamate dioxygenase ferredoxin component
MTFPSDDWCVSRTRHEEFAVSDVTRVCTMADIPDPGKAVFEVDDHFVVVFHLDGRFYALDDTCTHDGGPLGEGEIDGFQIICPRHGARFDIRTGQAMTMPAVRGTPSHEVKVEGEDVLVRIKD